MMDIIFEWDEQKNASNKVKHGIFQNFSHFSHLYMSQKTVL